MPNPYNAEGGPIDDVYAVNVDAETVWSSYYTDFPIVRIADNAVSTWRGGGAGARALVVDGERCAVVGGYGAERNRILLGSLTSEGFARRATVKIGRSG